MKLNENLESQLNQGADNLSVILMIAKGLGVAEERVMTLAHIIEERKRQDQSGENKITTTIIGF